MEVVCVDQDEPEKMVQGDAGLEDISSGSDLVECLVSCIDDCLLCVANT